MNVQMMRVISSPSISTRGFVTLIFAILRSHLLRAGIGNGRRIDGKFGVRSLKTPLPPDSASERDECGVQRGARPHRGRRLGGIGPGVTAHVYLLALRGTQ